MTNTNLMENILQADTLKLLRMPPIMPLRAASLSQLRNEMLEVGVLFDREWLLDYNDITAMCNRGTIQDYIDSCDSDDCTDISRNLLHKLQVITNFSTNKAQIMHLIDQFTVG